MTAWPYGTSQWRGLRAAKLSSQPLCEACIRREVVEPANVVDHILAIAKGGDPFPPLSGLMSMCEPCHNAKTNAVDHPNASGFRRAIKGFDVDGNPLDGEGWERVAFAGRSIDGVEPAMGTNKDLVLILPNREAEQWV
ncbi:HNH endonuclease [Rhizobium mesoamericanum]|uniref:HNH endonuclease n=1 Tax=Rhizobium mesoamericanum TaxID=1079800 RepID=UPI0004250403|nr:HNH endonuclease signature motif containing protein [Rhizobium mesoamericanum]